MNWINDALNRLAAAARFSYGVDDGSATEPVALAALALVAHNRLDAAQRPLEWLDRAQHADGRLGVRQDDPEPSWPTALALLAWHHANQLLTHDEPLLLERRARIERGLAALLKVHGERGPRTQSFVGHDSRLVAWPWVPGTHSWIEPTALAVIALKALGHSRHARTREAVRLLVDRQLPTGGCNYGNTSVLGQMLRAHPQPTGMALVALSDETAADETFTARITASVQYGQRTSGQITSAVSTAWLMLGLAAHNALPHQTLQHLEHCYALGPAQRWSAHAAALLLLAAQGTSSLLVALGHAAGPTTATHSLRPQGHAVS